MNVAMIITICVVLVRCIIVDHIMRERINTLSKRIRILEGNDSK